MSQFDLYANPLITRYASRAMAELWSARRRVITWRRLWLALAEAQQELGLKITTEQLDELRAGIEQIDFERAAEHERRLRHDVMAHVHAYGEVAPRARPIIHLGATSAFVTDNTDLILLRDALCFVRSQLVGSIDALATFAERWKSLPCLGYTHFQPAQLVTVGKRATLWCFELVLDLAEVERRIDGLRFLGAKGTTGTQASFLALFGGDHAKVEALDKLVAEAFSFDQTYPVAGQTYSRKIDSQVVEALAGIGESAHRFGTDLRLLAHERELEEPFEAEQVGSSAMAYKRNPMRSERMCSLGRYLLGLPAVARQTAATQWLERSLDDSAARRIVLPEAFLAADALLGLYLNVVPGLEVHPEVIAQHVHRELPLMATENLMMAAVESGADRQEVHELVRKHSLAVSNLAKCAEPDPSGGLIARLAAEPLFGKVAFDALLDPKRYIGRCPQQVEAFLEREVEPIRRRYPDQLRQHRELEV